ncbi:MAG: hypothetical protein LIO53_04825 [Oscillospiraceae bacterium]|nr:hypothetical protein [Oscillospiraceae bacterium]
MRSIRNILGVSFGYAAAVIGAGFASGQEIVSFFVRYGKCSIVGIFIACAIFAAFAYAVLSVCLENDLHSYSDFLCKIFPNDKEGRAAEIAALVFAAASVCVMTACAGEMGFILIKIPQIVGALIFTVICGIIFFMENKKIMGINSVLGFVIVFGIILSCLYILRFREHQTAARGASMVISGTAYAGYNLLTAGAVLSGMSGGPANKKEAALSSAVSGFVLFVMITLIWGVLGIYYGKINLGEIPMLTMALRQNKYLGAFYGAMLFFAVITTGVSNGFGVIDIVEKKFGRKKSVLAMLAVCFCLSGAGFSNMINSVYRVCGYVGMIIVFRTIYVSILKAKKK